MTPETKLAVQAWREWAADPTRGFPKGAGEAVMGDVRRWYPRLSVEQQQQMKQDARAFIAGHLAAQAQRAGREGSGER